MCNLTTVLCMYTHTQYTFMQLLKLKNRYEELEEQMEVATKDNKRLQGEREPEKDDERPSTILA